MIAALAVDRSRMDTRRNHTATHLLNWALREVLGEHVSQAGSVVDPERLRFDFQHDKALTDEQLAEIERLVNQRVRDDEMVGINEIPLEAAMKIEGVRAVFGESYPDPVRVVSVGTLNPLSQVDRTCAVEFCGGTHLNNTGQMGVFKIVAEESVAKGVRRITAVTGRGAIETIQQTDQAMRQVAAQLKVPPGQAPERVAALQEEIKTLRKKLASGAGAGGGVDALAASAQTVGEAKLVCGELSVTSVEQLRTAADQIRQKLGDASAAMLGWVDDGKVMLIAAVSETLIKEHGLKAGDWVREVAPIVGGGGGGKPHMAQAGGKDPAKLPEALSAAQDWASRKLQD
jgi:alanyl-tRNA synthetase